MTELTEAVDETPDTMNVMNFVSLEDWVIANGGMRSVIDEMLQMEKQGVVPSAHLVWSWRVRLANAYNNIFYWEELQQDKADAADEDEDEDEGDEEE